MVCEMATARGMGSALPKHRRPTGAKPQRGQAMIWMLGMLAASGAVMFALFNTSQTTVSKERTINAADAAALAGATAEARLLNLMAYNNRAIIANEAFLIQLLSLESWMQYVGNTADNLGTVLDILSLIPPISVPAKIAATALDKAGTLAKKGHDALADKVTPKVITLLETSKKLIRNAHKGINASGSLLAADAARSVASGSRTDFGGRHDPGQGLLETPAMLGLTLKLNYDDWKKFTTLYTDSSPGGGRADAAQVLLDSRDGFTKERPGKGWLNFAIPIIPFVWKVGMEKNGGSRLATYDRWETEDTLEFKSWSYDCGWSGCGWEDDFALPMGWGRSNAANTADSGDMWAPYGIAQDLAWMEAKSHNKWTGVPTLYNVKDLKPASRPTLGLDFLVAVGRGTASDITTTSLKMGSPSTSVLGATDMPQAQASGRHTAFSKARVSFERPRKIAKDLTAKSLWRSDEAKEYGSLYSPYWQARLADLTVGEKTAMLAAVGLTPDYLLYTPGAQSK
jgi:hypothetical protein